MSTCLMLQIKAESMKLYKDVNNIQNHNGLKKGLFWLVVFHLPSSL